jgi:Transposase DDE domain
VTSEALLAAGYGGALLLGAALLEWLSSHTHRRALRFRTAGFTYHGGLDAWICPEGEHLWPYELDDERRLMRYRARAQVCNACPVKHRCTDSSEGREVVRPLDPWPHSEAGRFHRVLALMLVALACLIALLALARNHTASSAALLCALLVAAAAEARWLLRDLRRHPSGVPQAGGPGAAVIRARGDRA